MGDITVYGREWCEDTQVTRSSLQTLGIPYAYVDIEADTVAAKFVRDINEGREVTPTVLMRGEILVEPDPDELAGMLRATGLMV